MDNLTHNLEAMIYHQRQAEQSQDAGQQSYHHREALRYRLGAHKIEKQIKTTRQSISDWVCLN